MEDEEKKHKEFLVNRDLDIEINSEESSSYGIYYTRYPDLPAPPALGNFGVSLFDFYLKPNPSQILGGEISTWQAKPPFEVFREPKTYTREYDEKLLTALDALSKMAESYGELAYRIERTHAKIETVDAKIDAGFDTTFELLRKNPIQTVRLFSVILGSITLLSLILGKLIGEIVIAPGVGFLALLFFWGFFLVSWLPERWRK